ncbi:MAG: hypothetical protein K2L95_00175 [Alphaproteobacteria bacterium]|nr:hypothetical protein [Alphaproteobacteria bacterium]MDE6570625.1 hypothetical protein [Alphaproteobacteria bacterium]
MDMFSGDWLGTLDARIRNAGMDSDAQSFDEIRRNLTNPPCVTADEFFTAAAYVILAGGFSQKTAKRKHAEIMDCIAQFGADFDRLIHLFRNQNKIAAICKIWENRTAYRDAFYACATDDARLDFLGTLPHIGRITANHLGRNLGLDVVKYDIWIQRLGVLYARNPALHEKINNANLDGDVRRACDDMFAHLVRETGWPRGYIDVVLWKSAQQGLIKELI